jgi:hypothetical protein
VDAGSPLDGQCYVVVELGLGTGSQFVPLDVLVADVVSAAHKVAWPGTPLRGPLEGAGALRTITGTNPGAGNEIAETVPTGARWQLLAIRFQFLTSATVANRVPELALDDGVSTFLFSSNSVNQAASITLRYSYMSSFGSLISGVGNDQARSLPTPLYLGSGYRIRTSTSSIQVGDTYTAIAYLVREWIEGA